MLMGAKSCISITFIIKLILYKRIKARCYTKNSINQNVTFFVYVANSENFNLDKLP